MTETQLMTYFSVYGEITAVDIEKDPTTGGSLGVAVISFTTDGHDSARLAVDKGNGRTLGSAQQSVKVCFDPTGEQLKLAILEANKATTPTQTPLPTMDKSNHYYDDRDRKHQRYHYDRYRDDYYSRSPHYTTSYSSNRYQWRNYSQHRSLRRDYSRDSRYSRSPSRDYSRDSRYSRSPSRDDRRSRYTVVKKDRPILAISNKCLPFARGVLEDLKKLYHYYDFVDVSSYEN